MVIRSLVPVVSVYATVVGALMASYAWTQFQPKDTEARIAALTRKVRRKARLKGWFQ